MEEVKINEQTLINILDRFVENSPTLKKDAKTIMKSFDATTAEIKSCEFYIADIDFKPEKEINGYRNYPDCLKYKLTLAFVWGTEVMIEGLPNEFESEKQNSFYIKGYFDERWHWVENEKSRKNKSLNVQETADTMNNLILNIIQGGKYKHYYEEVEDYQNIRI